MGRFLRTVFLLHSTWFVNSATHMWGSKRFATDDDSRNLWWVAYLSFRRRLAQQSPRASAVGASRAGMVRVRSELVRHQGLPGAGTIWDIKLPKLGS